VGGPLDETCRLEGLLDTVVSRGRDLQRVLDDNNLVEVSLRKQIAANTEVEPTHPIVADLVDDISLTRSGDDPNTKSPSTPKSIDQNGLSQPILSTPVKGNVIVTQGSQDSFLEFDENGVAVYSPFPVFPGSPNSIDNADLQQGLPRYRRNDSESDLTQFAFGCGAASELFGDSLAGYGETTHSARQRSTSADLHEDSIPSIQPQFTSSFDGVNFRTGMSGHRALMSTKPGSTGYTQRSEVRMMSEHRGIARVRGPRRQSPNSSPSIGPHFDDFSKGVS
jgi:hypothetical protein